MPITEFPASLQARRVLRVGPLIAGARILELDGGAQVVATVKHLQSFSPQAGDYWVVPSAGHAYLLSKATFMKTYEAAEQP
jgi:hypothetical protein